MCTFATNFEHVHLAKAHAGSQPLSAIPSIVVCPHLEIINKPIY